MVNGKNDTFAFQWFIQFNDQWTKEMENKLNLFYKCFSSANPKLNPVIQTRADEVIFGIGKVNCFKNGIGFCGYFSGKHCTQ